MRYRGFIGVFLAVIGAKVPFIGVTSGQNPLQTVAGIRFATPIVFYSYIGTIGGQRAYATLHVAPFCC
jgi:hypothetical protein